MPSIKRINLKKFIPISLLITGLCLYLANSSLETFVILGIYLATLVNFLMLLGVIEKIITVATTVEPVDYSKLGLALVFVLKMAIIFAALTIGVHFMGKRIIIPLLNYVFQIFALGVSFKR